jgi:hypothetical protein
MLLLQVVEEMVNAVTSMIVAIRNIIVRLLVGSICVSQEKDNDEALFEFFSRG